MDELKMSDKAKSIKIGIYEHYKKRRYQVIGVALHSETLEEVVIYKALYGEELIWVRPIDMFFDDVDLDGMKHPRFRYLGNTP